MTNFFKILGLAVFSGLKFFLAPASTVLAGYNLIETMAITSIGGIVGFLIFLKFGILIHKTFMAFFKRKEKRLFSKKSRMIVNFKNKYGFWGLAIFTPILFGIPLGSILASAFFGHQKRTIPVFILFIILWSGILSYYSIYFKTLW